MSRWFKNALPLPLRRRLRAVADRLHGGQRNVLELPECLPDPPGNRVVVFAPHQDDEVIGCGGTLVRHHELGHRATVVFMTDGRQGYQFTHLRGDDLTETRRAEAQRAAAMLGVDECVFLDNPDTQLWNCRGVRTQVHDLLVRIRPDVVYLPAFTDTHTDHLHTFLAVADAAARLDTKSVYFMFETWSPLVANCVITIDMDRKLEALRAYSSQLGTQEAFLPAVQGIAKFRAVTCLLDANSYAEAFWRTDGAGLLQLAKWLR